MRNRFCVAFWPTVFVVVASVCAPVAAAESQNPYEAASTIGNMIAAEQTCDLKYDASAIQAWVEKHVPTNDLKFADMLSSQVHLSGIQQSEMSPTTKVAFCVQVRRSAKANGFTN